MNATVDLVKLAIESLEDHRMLTAEMDTALVRHIRGLEAERARHVEALEAIDDVDEEGRGEADSYYSSWKKCQSIASEALTPKMEVL